MTRVRRGAFLFKTATGMSGCSYVGVTQVLVGGPRDRVNGDATRPPS
jgi:hypothetical protein